MVKDTRRVHRMRIGHYETGRDSDCVGLFGLLAQWLERHPYKMCGPGSIPG